MAIYRPSAIVGAVSGALGGAVFVNAKGSAVVRHRPQANARTRSKDSPSLYDARGAMQRIVVAWRSMSATDQMTWRAIAKQYPTINRLGQKRPLSGYQLFLKHSLEWQAGASAVRTDPPRNGTTENFLTIAIDFDVDGPYNLSYTANSVSYNRAAVVYGRVLYGGTPPQNFVNLKVIGSFLLAGSPIDLQSQWIKFLPAPRVGQGVQVSVLMLGELRLNSSRLTASTTAHA